MKLQEFSLQNFRNYSKKNFRFGETTVVVGPNASGKTNLLEAIYLLATGDSFRAGRIEEMVSWGKEVSQIMGKVEGKDGVDLQVTLTRGEVQGERVRKRRLLVNGVARQKKIFIGNLVAVLFLPRDLELVGGSPSVRRNYLDQVLSQVDGEYRRSLMAYEKALRRRNKLLGLIREGEANRGVLAFWDQTLIKNGNVLTDKRREMINFVNSQESGGFGKLEVEYDLSAISEKRLAQYAREEVAAGYTLVGPHKDDFVVRSKELKIRSKGRDLAIYGSRGEQRLAVLWLKLVELEFVNEKIGRRPVLLLDDILSELDRKHKKVVMELFGKQQTIITTTELKLIDKGIEAIEL